MEPDIQKLENRIHDLELKLNRVLYPDRYQFDKTVRHSGQKLGFFNAISIAQWASGTGRGDSITNTGTPLNINVRLNGNTGTTYYGLGDVVAALKAFGLLKQ